MPSSRPAPVALPDEDIIRREREEEGVDGGGGGGGETFARVCAHAPPLAGDRVAMEAQCRAMVKAGQI